MSDSKLAVVAAQTFQAPILIERAGPSTRKKFLGFFACPRKKVQFRIGADSGLSLYRFWVYSSGALGDLFDNLLHLARPNEPALVEGENTEYRIPLFGV
jgi:hypothetical protein